MKISKIRIFLNNIEGGVFAPNINRGGISEFRRIDKCLCGFDRQVLHIRKYNLVPSKHVYIHGRFNPICLLYLQH